MGHNDRLQRCNSLLVRLSAMEHQLLMVSSQFLSMEEMIELQVNALQRSREIMAKAGIFLDVPLMDDFEVRNETDELLLMAGAPGSAVRKPRSPTQPGESNTQVPLDDGPEGAADSALALETDEVPSPSRPQHDSCEILPVQ